jgi:hypothetical protein
MRLNIEWVAPWLHGKPIKSWFWHSWYIPKGKYGKNRSEVGFKLFGFHVELNFSALWSGIGIGISLCERKR